MNEPRLEVGAQASGPAHRVNLATGSKRRVGDRRSNPAFRVLLAILGTLAFENASLGQVPTSNFPTAETSWLTRLGSRGVRVHDPSTIVQCGDEYWVFYTGRGIPSYCSKDLQTWQPVTAGLSPWMILSTNPGAFYRVLVRQ